jgi:alkylhydroperoxidase family enzyme
MNQISFLGPAERTPEVESLYEQDVAEDGYIANASRLWAYQPQTYDGLYDLMGAALADHPLTVRERAVLIAACASTVGDAYCSLAWGTKLAAASDEPTAAGVLLGHDHGLTDPERAMAAWARKVAKEPNATTVADIDELRGAGFSDAHIFAITVYIALRMALAAVNDALGAHPDAEFRRSAPHAVLAAVNYGRPVAETRSGLCETSS